MGVGKPTDLVEAVARGVDLFDCVLPTRNARNGQAFTPDGPLNIEQRAIRPGRGAARPGVPCEACRRFSRAYLRHLFMARELLAYRLLTLHNLTFYLGLMAAMRRAVAEGRFAGSGLSFSPDTGRRVRPRPRRAPTSARRGRRSLCPAPAAAAIS